MFLFAVAYKLAKEGGLNQGIIPILTLFASFFNSILFYYKFDEKLNLPKVLGMIMASFCAIFLGLDSQNRMGEVFVDEDGVPHSKTAYSLGALGLGSLVPVGYTLKHYMVRKYKGTYNYNVLPVDSAIFESFICSLAIPFFFTGDVYLKAKETNPDYTTEWYLLLGGISGCLMVLGRIYIAIGIGEGVAGPAQAVMSTNGIWMTFLAVFIDGQKISKL